MSIQTEITRIRTAKEDLKTAINAKGGSLADETLDHYAQAVTDLPESGTDTSDATATEENILNGYTAYVKGEKITGTHLCACDGYDISAATATAADILEGKTAFAGNGKITGTIPVQPGEGPVLTPGQTVYLSRGYYASEIEVKAGPLNIDPENIRDGFWDTGLSRPGTFTRDATATAADIIKGKTAGVKGEMVTGTLVPSTGSTFYKCTAVDTENMTWSGQKAVLTDGVYSFEETVTNGLTYTSITPVVGKTYSADALVLVGSLYSGFSLPQEGLLACAFPDSTWTEGQAVSTWGDFSQSDTSAQTTIASINGVKGLATVTNKGVTAKSSAITGDFTYACAFYVNGSQWQGLTLLNDNTNYGAIFLFDVNNQGLLLLSKQGSSYIGSNKYLQNLQAGKHTAVVTFNASTGETKFYLDGDLDTINTYDASFQHTSTFYSMQTRSDSNTLIRGLAVWSRVLSSTEIENDLIWEVHDEQNS